MKFRFFTLLLFFTALYNFLGYSLYNLQIKQNSYYIEKMEAINEIQAKLYLKRGQIFITDRHNNKIPIAANKDYPVIYAVPKEIKDPQSVAKALASIIDQSEKELIEALDNPELKFRLLVDKASEEELAAVKKLALDNIYIDQRQHRHYPYEKLASHTIGFVGTNEDHNIPSGLYGIEKYYDDKLAFGNSVYLTIDRSIQAQAEQILSELVEKFDAAGGTIIVQEPATGKILALANAPDFTPNAYNEADIQNFINPAIQSIYEPGSVFKPLTIATGIDLEIITPETTFYDKGSITLNGKTIKNWDLTAHGNVTMTNVLEKSINTGAVFAVQKIGLDNFLSYLKKFGLGAITEISLPDEVNGSLNNLENLNVKDIDLATSAFGQGIAVTPIQLINAFGSIANGGELKRPIIIQNQKSQNIRRVLKKETSETITDMLYSAVRGAYIADLPQHKIAGKTGTAQVPNFEKGGYTEEFIHTFVGFGPASDPKFTALIKLDKPNVTLAGHTVVPAFRNLAQFILSYYNIAPDKSLNNN